MVYNLIKKELIMFDGMLHHDCLTLLIAFVEFVVGDVAEEVGVLLHHIFTVVSESRLHL